MTLAMLTTNSQKKVVVELTLRAILSSRGFVPMGYHLKRMQKTNEQLNRRFAVKWPHNFLLVFDGISLRLTMLQLQYHPPFF